MSSDEQRTVAEDTIADVNAAGLWPGKVVTEVHLPAISGRPNPSTRTISSAVQADTHATSSGPSGSCQSGLRPKGTLALKGAASGGENPGLWPWADGHELPVRPYLGSLSGMR